MFDRKESLIERLVTQIRTGIQQRLRGLSDDPKHPFLSRRAAAIDFIGSWSVQLRSKGFHIRHIHQNGWMSSAVYVGLPPEIGRSDDGALVFGVADAALGRDLPPRRIERPHIGRLELFSSYFWHGTLPIDSAHPRLRTSSASSEMARRQSSAAVPALRRCRSKSPKAGHPRATPGAALIARASAGSAIS